MVVVVMGVSGSGKTTVGRALAARLDWTFEDGDELHPPTNVEKMHRGIALTDEDRAPWLHRVGDVVEAHVASGADLVLACSALRRAYRDAIRTRGDAADLCFVYLKGSYELLAARVRARTGHFMPPSLLPSQFDTLEEPTSAEAIVVDVAPPVPAIVDAIVRALFPGGAPVRRAG